jgi:hypothetical protein
MCHNTETNDSSDLGLSQHSRNTAINIFAAATRNALQKFPNRLFTPSLHHGCITQEERACPSCRPPGDAAGKWSDHGPEKKEYQGKWAILI